MEKTKLEIKNLRENERKAVITYSYPDHHFSALEKIWHHPMLDFYQEELPNLKKNKSNSQYKLKIFPTANLYPDGASEDEVEFSPLSELPNLENWSMAFCQVLVEIFSKRRSPNQLARWCHHQVYHYIIERIKLGFPKDAAIKIRRVIVSQPLPGIAEVTLLLAIGPKVRAIAIRFEGVAKKWQACEFKILE
jgi:Family of unknown function (DUF6459)